MREKQRDPVDLMLEGKLQEATKLYLDLYVEAIEEGDRWIGRDLVTQLHYCIAGRIGEDEANGEGRSPEDVTKEVEEVILNELSLRGVRFDKSAITDDIEIASEDLRRARKRAEKSIEAVEHEKENRRQ